MRAPGVTAIKGLVRQRYASKVPSPRPRPLPGARCVLLPDGQDSLAVGGRELGCGLTDVAKGVPATAQCRCRDGGRACATGSASAVGGFSASARIVVQASSAA